MEIEFAGSYLDRDKKFDLEIFMETPDDRRKVVYRKRDSLEPKLVLNNPFPEEIQVTVGFIISKTVLFVKKIKDTRRVTIWPNYDGWHEFLKKVKIRFLNNKGKLRLEVTKLRIKFSPHMLPVDPITGISPVNMTMCSNTDHISNFFSYLNNVNRHRILKAREDKKDFVDILKLVHVDNQLSVSGTSRSSYYINDRSGYFRTNGSWQGIATSKPRFYFQAQRYPLSKYNFPVTKTENLMDFTWEISETEIDEIIF